jgi:acetylornithine deacetylase
MAHQSLIELVSDLVRFPSPQTDQMEFEPQVQNFIGECVSPRLERLGLKTRRDSMGNLIAELGRAGASRSVLLMTYAMTHPQSRMTDPWTARVVDTPQGPAIRGRGISEQKAALAAALMAIESLQASQNQLDGHLVFVLSSAGETGRHDAARAALKEIGTLPKLGLVALGTNNRMALGNKGRIDVDVLVHGKASHSSTPWDGINAIEGLHQVLERLRSLALPDREHPGLGRVTLTPTRVVTGPNATHTVQDIATLTLDRRLLPGEDPEIALKAIADCVALPSPWQVEVKLGPFMYPCEISPDGALARAILAGHRKAGLPAPATFFSHSALDAGFLQQQGCEATMFGPGRMEQFHSEDEFIAVSELEHGAAAYLGFLQEALQ